jgi:16S rRNA (cytosine967-C5)-methyltransferase
VAARAVDGVLTSGRSLERAFAAADIDALPDRDRAQAQALAYGSLRWHHRNRLIIGELLDHPLAPRDSVVEALISVGLCQLTEARQPAYAAVSATVDATQLLHRPHTRGLVNAVLRRFIRQRKALTDAANVTDEGRYAHPDWLIRQIRQDWPAHWSQVLEAANAQPPMWLRVNRQHTTRDEYQARLERVLGQPGATADGFSDAVRLDVPVPVGELPGFNDGDVSVQDAAAQLAVDLLDPQPGCRILDACAAPGGKTTHLLERQPDIAEVVAVDITAERMERLQRNLDRLGLHATVVEGDAAVPSGWWDGQLFDRVLIDAPCSATGVIRRHPDIKFLRRASDTERFAEQQLNMIKNLWPLLAPGGMMLYATCSVLRAENSVVVESFVAGRDDVRLGLPRTLPDAAVMQSAGHQLLPGTGDTDGFYYALMERTNSKNPRTA